MSPPRPTRWPPDPVDLVAEPALVAGFLIVFVDVLHKVDLLD
jgi:hypothetical protein